MVGITSYGAYVPLFRLNREAIAKGARGEKSICGFDEDSVTMAVAAANGCLKGVDRKTVDGLYFASTTSPYKEKESAPIVAMGANLKEDIFTSDFASSLKAGTGALMAALDAVKAGSAKQVMVTAADGRLGVPGSPFEQNAGDGAGALLIGDKNVAVSVEGSYSVYREILDIWRSNQDTYARTWEDRFAVTHGYLETTAKAVTGLMKKYNLKPEDFAKVVLYSPDARRYAEVARKLGFDAKTQVQDPLFMVMGNTGAAFPLMLLIAALEEAKPGDLILLASYGNGSDAFVLKVTEHIEKLRKNRLGMKGHLASKKVIDDYRKYLIWRGILPFEDIPGPVRFLSAPASWREAEANLRLQGVKCKVCSTLQFPPQRVCTNCRTKDQFEPYHFSDKKAKIFTFAMDYVTPFAEMPTVTTTIDFDGGGRMECYMTDAEPEQVKCGLEVEMGFRRIIVKEGAQVYFWKSMPVRG